MNTIKNHIQLVGKIEQDPEITPLENGKVVAQFSIAVEDTYKDLNGKNRLETHWHSIVAWGKLALIIEKHAIVEERIAIEGKLAKRSYKTEDGEKRYYVEIIARGILFLGSKNGK